MINFDEEIKKFQPCLEMNQAEDAIYHNDVKDIKCGMKLVLPDVKNEQ